MSTTSTHVDLTHHFIEQLDAGKFQEATRSFDATVAGLLNADALSSLWAQLQSEGGKFQEQRDARSSTYGEHDVVFFTLRHETRNFEGYVAYDHDHKIAGLAFAPLD